MEWIWASRAELASLTLTHAWLSAVPVVIGLAVATPLGWWISRHRRTGGLVLGLGSILYTIPSLALFVILPGIIGTGFLSPLNVIVALSVWLGGKAVGTVHNIGFLPRTADSLAQVSMHLDLPRSVSEQIRADSRVRLTTARLVGERVVDIVPGTAAAPMLAEGDTLFVRNSITVAQLTARAAVVKSQLDTALADIRELMPLVETRMAETQRAFGSLDVAMTQGRELAAAARSGPALSLMNDPAFRASVERIRSHTSEMPRMLETLRAQAGAPAEARAALARLQLRADTLGRTMARISAMLNDPNSTMSRFRQDSALVRALRAARTDLDSLIAESRRKPLRYFFGK